MSARLLEILKQSGHRENHIPCGRQLLRTPPFSDVKKHLDFSNEDCGNPQEEAAVKEENDPNRTFDFSSVHTKTEPDDPDSMLRGMTGYQLTQSDLEFIEKLKEERLMKKLQGDLEEVQRLLKKETMAAELVCASRDKAEAELQKLPSCEELTEWVKVVLNIASPSVDLTDLDRKSLLAMVTKEDVQRVIKKKQAEVARLEKKVADKRKKEAKEQERLAKQVASEKLKIQESEHAVRGRRTRRAAQDMASEPKRQASKVKTGEVPTHSRRKAAELVGGGEEAPTAGVRRSKRIASRTVKS